MPLKCDTPVTYQSTRLEMLRPLTPKEQTTYRGITSFAMTGQKYDQLYNITTASELITAELYGRRAIPSDEPSSMYLFSASRGKTAKFNDSYFAAVRKREKEAEEKDETGELKRIRERYIPKSMEELHMQYLDMEVPGSEEDKKRLEEELTEVAENFVIWWNGMVETRGFGCSHGKEKEKGKEEEKGI
jgi:hypothetical protein